MTTTLATQRQKAVQAWVKLRAQTRGCRHRQAPKHGKKSST